MIRRCLTYFQNATHTFIIKKLKLCNEFALNMVSEAFRTTPLMSHEQPHPPSALEMQTPQPSCLELKLEPHPLTRCCHLLGLKRSGDIVLNRRLALITKMYNNATIKEKVHSKPEVYSLIALLQTSVAQQQSLEATPNMRASGY